MSDLEVCSVGDVRVRNLSHLAQLLRGPTVAAQGQEAQEAREGSAIAKAAAEPTCSSPSDYIEITLEGNRKILVSRSAGEARQASILARYRVPSACSQDLLLLED